MNVIKNLPGKIKGNGTAPVSTPDTPATTALLPAARPKRRESLFAGQIWNVERKPTFTHSRIYGFAG